MMSRSRQALENQEMVTKKGVSHGKASRENSAAREASYDEEKT